MQSITICRREAPTYSRTFASKQSTMGNSGPCIHGKSKSRVWETRSGVWETVCRLMYQPFPIHGFAAHTLGLHIKDTDAVDYLVDCYVLAVTEVAEVEILFFLLSVDFFWAENRCYNAAFRWKKTMNTFHIS